MPDRRTVLIVDDDEDVRSSVAEVLEDVGYCAETAENGLDALKRMVVEHVRPALILLDLMMPEMDGFEFLENIRKVDRWSDIPTVVLTAKNLSELPGNALRYITRLSELIGRPVGIVSVGPDRDQTILAEST